MHALRPMYVVACSAVGAIAAAGTVAVIVGCRFHTAGAIAVADAAAVAVVGTAAASLLSLSLTPPLRSLPLPLSLALARPVSLLSGSLQRQPYIYIYICFCSLLEPPKPLRPLGPSKPTPNVFLMGEAPLGLVPVIALGSACSNWDGLQWDRSPRNGARRTCRRRAGSREHLCIRHPAICAEMVAGAHQADGPLRRHVEPEAFRRRHERADHSRQGHAAQQGGERPRLLRRRFPVHALFRPGCQAWL